jgi:acetylornithine/N-succinyldiaminopimelate aminotransferase
MIPVVMPTYARIDLAFERGEGAYLWTTDGRRFLDFMAGIAVCGLGHAHPRVVAALEEQARKLWHVSNIYRSPGQEKLAQRLVENSFADTVFFTNSGVEAWEGGAKLCRRYHWAKGNPKRWRIITVQGAFHGRTLTAISAAKSEKLTKGFGPLVEGFDQVAWHNMNELRAAITDETAAINIEPIIGEGGIKTADVEFLRALRAVCDEYGILLFLDEIQCGYGRTGKLFAHEWAGITPDVMCVAKGIGNGFPLGAFMATEDAACGMTVGTHGTTYGGNALAMAVGNAVLDEILAPGFLDRVVATGAKLKAGLEAIVARHPGVFEEVRGLGLLLGLKCTGNSADVGADLRAEGLLTVGAAEEVIRIMPPLTIGDAEIAEGLAIIERVAAARSSRAMPPPKVAHHG